MNLALVLLILAAVIGAKADRVAKVVRRQPRHHRVQVDDAQPLHRPFVQQDVVELGVVVGDPQRQLAPLLQVEQVPAVRLMLPHKFDLPLHLGRAAHCVLLHRPLKVLVTLGGVVEAGDGLGQAGGVKGPQLPLEAAKGGGALEQVLLVARLLQADAALDVGEHPPAAPFFIPMVEPAVVAGDHPHALPANIPAGLPGLLGDKLGHQADVLHQPIHILKGVGVDALQNIPTAGALHQIGVVDMPAAKRGNALDAAELSPGPQGKFWLFHSLSLSVRLISATAALGTGPARSSWPAPAPPSAYPAGRSRRTSGRCCAAPARRFPARRSSG